MSNNNKITGDDDFQLIVGKTTIDYDDDKEEINRKKHGYSLESARSIFERELLMMRYGARFMKKIVFNREVRHLHLALGDQKELVFFVTTIRANDIIRIISFRKVHIKKDRNMYILYSQLCTGILGKEKANAIWEKVIKKYQLEKKH